MAQTYRPQSVLSRLQSDVRAHPRVDALVAATVVLGLVAAISAAFTSLHLLSSWAGLAGIVTGGTAQYHSQNTGERFVVVIALGASAIGFALGIAHGGLYGGV